MTSLEVLMVTSEVRRVEVLVRELQKAGYAPNVSSAESETELIHGLERNPQVILAEYVVGGLSVLRVLEILRGRFHSAPVLVLADSLTHQQLVQVIKAGAEDYLPWDRIGELGEAVRKALPSLSARRRESLFRALHGADLLGAFLWNIDGAILDANDSFLNMLGYDRTALEGGLSWRTITPPESVPWDMDGSEQLRRHGRCVPYEKEYLHRDGRRVPVLIAASRWNDREGVAFALNLTHAKLGELCIPNLAAIADGFEELAFITHSLDGVILTWNPGAARLFGYDAAEIVGRSMGVLVPDEFMPLWQAKLTQVCQGKRVSPYQTKRRRKNGALLDVSACMAPVMDRRGHLAGIAKIVLDLTHQVRMEEQFRQAQKMEAVGRLAGGVAHDFNNLLTVICGYSELLLARLPWEEPAHDLVAEIRNAGAKAAALTRHLLVFSRKSILEPRICALNDIVREGEKLLRRLVGEDVEVRTILTKSSTCVNADPTQLEQALINLVVNSRDAMPRGGADHDRDGQGGVVPDVLPVERGGGAGNLRDVGRVGYGAWNSGGRVAAHLRAVFHDEGAGAGNGSGVADGAWVCEAKRRAYSGDERIGEGDDGAGISSACCRGGRRSAARGTSPHGDGRGE